MMARSHSDNYVSEEKFNCKTNRNTVKHAIVGTLK